MDTPVDPTQTQYVPQDTPQVDQVSPDDSPLSNAAAAPVIPADTDDTGPAPTPGSLGYVPPKVPEATTPAVELTPPTIETLVPAEMPTQVETVQPEVAPEILAPAETVQNTPPPIQPQDDDPGPVATAPAAENSLEEHVVDKTDELTQLHTLAKPKDKLTARADEEEEEFIKEVEAAHGHGK